MAPPLIKRIQERFHKMSANQKLIANYLLQNYDHAAFMTAQQLGDTLDISESTVIRFATFLDYSGYPEMHKSLQDMIKNKISTVERLQLSVDNKRDNVIEKVLKSDIANIGRTLEDINPHVFSKAVAQIMEARSIYIISYRSASSLGQFLHFYLQLILKNSHIVGGISNFFEELISIGREDVAIGITFPRYSVQAIESLKYAREKGAHTIAITDSVASPLARYADHCLVAHSEMTSFIDSFVAPLSLINALIIAVGTKDKDKTTQTLSQLEDIWARFKVYYTENGDI